MVKYENEIKEMNLWEKMSQISSEVDAVFKDMQVGSSSSKFAYKAVGVEQVITKVNEKLTKYGLVIYPVNQKIDFVGEEVVKTDGTITRNRVVNAEIEYEVVNIHRPEEKIRTFGFAQGLDTGDKASGKANTYCYKYVLLRLFNIAVLNEDPDKTHSNDLNKDMYSGNKGFNKTGISQAQKNRLLAIAGNNGYKESVVLSAIKRDYNLNKIEDLNKTQYEEICNKFENAKKKE